MTNERKAELFDKALDYIFSKLVYADETEYEETLEAVGFTQKEIDETLKEIFNDEE